MHLKTQKKLNQGSKVFSLYLLITLSRLKTRFSVDILLVVDHPND